MPLYGKGVDGNIVPSKCATNPRTLRIGGCSHSKPATELVVVVVVVVKVVVVAAAAVVAAAVVLIMVVVVVVVVAMV